MIRKECLRPKCGLVYRENELGFSLDYCSKCGALLKIINEDGEENLNFHESNEKNFYENNEMEEKSKEEIIDILGKSKEKNESLNVVEDEFLFFYVDEEGYIHFDNSNCEEFSCDRLIVYKDSKVFKITPLVYDEIIIGRNNSKFNVDVDLSSIDDEKIVSRRHAMIYKCNDEFLIRNLSTKNSVHINSVPLTVGEEQKLQSNDLIILSREVVIEYVAKEPREEA